MAKFVFRLNGYLGVKEKIEEQKKLEYGQALKRLEDEKQKKIRLLAQRDEQIEIFRGSLQNQINPSDIQRYNNTIELLKYKIKEQDKRITAAEANAETKRLELVEAVKQRKMLTSVKEKQHEEYMRAAQVAEQKIVDGIVSYQYANRET